MTRPKTSVEDIDLINALNHAVQQILSELAIMRSRLDQLELQAQKTLTHFGSLECVLASAQARWQQREGTS